MEQKEQSNFTTNFDLLKLNGAFVKQFTGKTATKACIVIPLEDADLYQRVNEDLKLTGVYLSLAHFELKEPGKYGDTHIVKQSHSKAWNESHSKEEKDNEPILGNSSPIKEKERIANIPSMTLTQEEIDDLPF